MKLYTLKFYLIALGFTFVIPAVNAQFDDVYYDPDNDVVETNYNYSDPDTGYSSEEDVTYYDNDEYEYYDDYDYYYSSRIKRFYRPSYGADFYDPYYIDSYRYDPYHVDSYYYPGATIYLSFGNSSYWDYRHWRRWNSWNNYSHFNNWCITPASYYYSYNNWCSPSSNYWGGYNGYYSYSNYYNNYYNSCPSPVSNYYGINHTTVTNVNTGGTRGTYYGPRITGNTGSSPRGPIANPGSVQPVYKDADKGVTQSNDKPRDGNKVLTPGINTSPAPGLPGSDNNPRTQPVIRDDNSKGVVKQAPVDKELKRENTSPTPQRPVFRPDSEKYKPYPNDKPTSGSDRTPSDRPAYTPTSPSRENDIPRTQDKPQYTPARENDKPSYTPRQNGGNERPSYSPPERSNGSNDSKPSPSPRHEENRTNDKPSYSPPPRNNDSGRSNNDSGNRSNDNRPSASPSSGNHNQSSGNSNRSEPSRSSSPSSSGSSPRGGRG